MPQTSVQSTKLDEQAHLQESCEQSAGLEDLMQSLITMQGKLNQKMLDLNRRVHQLEQSLLEARSSPDERHPVLAGHNQIPTHHSLR